jgi:hypothetical protein
MSVVPLAGALGLRDRWPRAVESAYGAAFPFRLVNHYGLFAVMTTSRPEIVIEGSADGIEWRAYEFRHKPGDLSRRPELLGTHMPRLDWQMWFAALSSPGREPWFLELCGRLLEGAPAVRALLAGDPFPDGPPRYLRATVWEYRFTDPATRRASGAWWTRERPRPYLPAVRLEGGRLVPAPSTPRSSSPRRHRRADAMPICGGRSSHLPLSGKRARASSCRVSPGVKSMAWWTNRDASTSPR